MPAMVEVFPLLLHPVLDNSADMFRALLATPLMVDVRNVPPRLRALVLTAGAVTAIPFTVLVIVFAAEDKVLVVVPVWFVQPSTPAPLVDSCCPIAPSPVGRV